MKTKHFLRTLALSGLIVSIFTISGCKERESNSSSLTQNNVSLTEDSSKPIEEVSSSLNSSENTLVDSSVESSSTISSLEENSSPEESSSSINQNNIERDEGVIYKDATFVYDGNPHLHTVNTFNKAKGTKGNMYVIIKVITPKKLSREQKKLIESLDRTDLYDSEIVKFNEFTNNND